MRVVGGHSGRRSTVLGMLQLPGSDFTRSSLPRGSPGKGWGRRGRSTELWGSSKVQICTLPSSVWGNGHIYVRMKSQMTTQQKLVKDPGGVVAAKRWRGGVLLRMRGERVGKP